MDYDPKAFIYPSLLSLASIPSGDNPFNHDLVQMGTPLVRGWFAMHPGYDNKDHPCPLTHVDLVNTRSGQRLRIQLHETPAEDNADVFVEISSYLKHLGDKLRLSPVSDAQEVTDHLDKLDRWAQAVQSKTELYIQHRRGYVVYGSTWCTCCSKNDFLSDVLDDAADAVRRADNYVEERRVSSQYSATGVYTVYQLDYEVLPDGRVIAQGHVFQSLDWLSIKIDGNDCSSFVSDLKQVHRAGKVSY